VLLADGTTVAVEELATGSAVASAADQPPTTVYGWTHKRAGGRRAFVRLSVDGRAAALTLSPGHYVVTSERLVAAAAIAVGDRLVNATGGAAIVTGVSRVWAAGLYHPHTTSGTLVVDGLLVSDLTTALPPAVSRALLQTVQRLGVGGGGGVGGWLLGRLEGGVSARLGRLLPPGAAVAPLM